MPVEDKGDIYSNVKKRSFQMEAEYDATHLFKCKEEKFSNGG